jgi:hypothetical protein
MRELMTTFIHVSPGTDAVNPNLLKSLVHFISNPPTTGLISKVMRFAFESIYIWAILRVIFQFEDAPFQGGFKFTNFKLIRSYQVSFLF